MSDEQFNRTNADALTQKIAERLGERQRKLEMMACWECNDRKRRLTSGAWISTAVAACLLFGIFISPLLRQQASPLDELGIATPTLSTFRAATPAQQKIVTLLNGSDYDALIELLPNELKNSDEMLKTLSIADDEEAEYEAEVEMHYNCELRWIYIYALVKTNKTDDAIGELEVYLQQKDLREHSEDAERLLTKLKSEK